MKILFFSWLKDEISKDHYILDIDHPLSILELKSLLIKKIGQKALVLKNQDILCAVNLSVVYNESILVNDKDEIAFYPPVTGG